MSLGKPVIVSNIGWFSELPNNTCLKVNVDSDQENVLLELFMLLAEKINLRELLGKNAREYIIKKHDPELAVKDIMNLFRVFYLETNLSKIRFPKILLIWD